MHAAVYQRNVLEPCNILRLGCCSCKVSLSLVASIAVLVSFGFDLRLLIVVGNAVLLIAIRLSLRFDLRLLSVVRKVVLFIAVLVSRLAREDDGEQLPVPVRLGTPSPSPAHTRKHSHTYTKSNTNSF